MLTKVLTLRDKLGVLALLVSWTQAPSVLAWGTSPSTNKETLVPGASDTWVVAVSSAGSAMPLLLASTTTRN